MKVKISSEGGRVVFVFGFSNTHARQGCGLGRERSVADPRECFGLSQGGPYYLTVVSLL